MKWYNMMPFFCCCCSVFYSLSLGHLQFSLTFNTSYSPSLIWTISASTDELQRARDIVNYFGCACVCHPDVAWVATKYFCTHLSSGSGICPVSRVLRSSISLCRLRKFFIFSWFNLLTVQMSAISNECSRPSVCVCVCFARVCERERQRVSAWQAVFSVVCFLRQFCASLGMRCTRCLARL